MKRRPIFILFLFLLPLSSLVAQSSFPLGLEMDDEAYQELPYSSENIKLEDGRRYFPTEIDLSPYCPEIRHQGEISSCVGWSLGYGALTIERAIKNDWKDKRQISQNANSALFVFNQISNGECNRGISLTKALFLLQEKGNCLARDFDYDINDCSKAVPSELLENASDYRISDFIRLYKLDTDPDEKIKKTKLVLSQKKPVVVGMKVLQNFYDLKAGDKTWRPNRGNKTYMGGHAMVVVGYDDNKFTSMDRDYPANKRGAFKLMNSWGKNWGMNGYIWVKYEDFAEYCRYAFAILLEEGEPINLDTSTPMITQAPPEEERSEEQVQGRDLLQLSGAFGFRHYIGWDEGPVFNEADVYLEDNVYHLKGKWGIGDQFQLYTQNDFDQGYVYVLSVDGTGKSEIHFPRSEEYSGTFEGLNESALMMTGGSILTIPTKESVLKLTKRGQDHLVVLFSTKKIVPKYIALLARELSKSKGDLVNRLHEILDKHMIPLTDSNLNTSKMGFEVSTRSEGKIVPIVLRVDVSE